MINLKKIKVTLTKDVTLENSYQLEELRKRIYLAIPKGIATVGFIFETKTEEQK